MKIKMCLIYLRRINSLGDALCVKVAKVVEVSPVAAVVVCGAEKMRVNNIVLLHFCLQTLGGVSIWFAFTVAMRVQKCRKTFF
jgi:hypothetical protein